jgi:Flp pilus assembly protein TadG
MTVGRGRGRTDRAGRRRTRRRGERGNALVEAVIIIPVLMLITFGGIEFGIGFSQKGALESAARAGAREGATLTTDTNDPLPNNAINQDTAIGHDVAVAVNAALDATAVPQLIKVYVYRSDVAVTGTGSDTTCINSDACIVYSQLKDGGKHFDETQPQGHWPASGRHGCGSTPDKVSVRIIGQFAFLTGLVGSGSITLNVNSTLQFEPTDC